MILTGCLSQSYADHVYKGKSHLSLIGFTARYTWRGLVAFKQHVSLCVELYLNGAFRFVCLVIHLAVSLSETESWGEINVYQLAK